jgi:DNA-binding MltR family transcriptional regulator
MTAAAKRQSDSNAFDTFADDLLAERNVRPLIIVGASKIDDLLLEMLRAYLLPKKTKPKEQDELLEGDTPLGTFSARIKMCRRLGLIDENLCTALEKLRVLRNRSAHKVAFDHSESPDREHVSDFRGQMVDRKSFGLTRNRYFESEELRGIEDLQCSLLTLCVLLEAARKCIGMTKGNRKALGISSK